jgi:Ca2+-binding EF-hand superfamily protein
MTGSGTISWTEFLASTIETLGPVSEEEFSSAFDHLDLDSSGYISTGVRFRNASCIVPSPEYSLISNCDILFSLCRI